MDNRKKVIALGFFDGVHLGHQPLLQKVAERSRQLDMTPAVFTFDRSPREFVTGIPVPLLTTAEERRQRVMDLCDGCQAALARWAENREDGQDGQS